MAKADILLVEDKRDDVELTLLALEDDGVDRNIDVVRDGAEALEYIFCTGQYADRDIHDQPRLIMLDLKLPKVNGIEVLERIKSDPRTKTIPITVLTSSREVPDIQACYDLGVNSYIVKPVDYDQFIEVVKDLDLYWLVRNQPPDST